MKAWKLRISLILVGLSAALFVLHNAIFHDAKTLGFYLALDVVFVPVQVLLVSILIERLLEERERQALFHKLNMVVGAFFGELGNELLRCAVRLCLESEQLGDTLTLSASWKRGHFDGAMRFAEGHRFDFKKDREALEVVRDLLLRKRSFVLGLLQNPNLLENDRFTDMIWAVCHLSEELEARRDLKALPDSDVDHLLGDLRRAFSLLIREWLAYMEHLQRSYPYMYSLAVRTNPFLPGSSPVVT